MTLSKRRQDNASTGRRSAAPQRGAAAHRLTRSTLLIAILMAVWANVQVTAAQPDEPTEQVDRPQTAIETILDAPGVLESGRAVSWREGEIRWVLLSRDVRVTVGTYGFRADQALVRMQREQREDETVHRLAIYLDNARALRGHGRVETEAPRLLVTVATRGSIELVTDLLEPADRAPGGAFVGDGLARIHDHLSPRQRAEQPPIAGPRQPRLADRRAEQPQPPTPAPADPWSRRMPRDPATPVEGVVQDPPPQAVRPQPVERRVLDDLADQRIVPAAGVVNFLYDRIESEPLDEESRYVALMGNVQVMYQEFETRRTMTLTADNAVIILAGARTQDLFDGRSTDAASVQGIYLEGNVIVSDGLYTVRAPRMYLDTQANRALVLDAVVYTIDVERRIPLYLRAKALRQESRTRWAGESVTLTTSEFARPHFAIGAGRLQFDQIPDTDTGEVRQRFDSRHNVFRAMDVPIFYWPRLAGDVTDEPPIERISGGFRRRDGRFEPELRTRWNLFALAGYEAPPGVALSGDLDYRGDHGAGLGLHLRYDVPDMYGNLQGYLLPYDQGIDRVGGRDEIEFDGQTRGFLSLRHRQYLRHHLELSLELGYASDPTFLEEFFPSEAYNAKPYETSAYLKQQQDDRAFTFLARYTVNDFLPQLADFQTPGYFVEKLPELTYRQIGTSLLNDRLTYFTENRLTRMRIRPGRDTPQERGFGPFVSPMLFGMSETTTFREAAVLAGIPRDHRLRFDTRHELVAPMRWGILDVAPYIAGRVTAYDDDFSGYSGEDDNVRFWGAVGARLHTSFTRTWPGVRSRILDLDRLRHIIEPSANIFLMGSTIDPDDLPVYDYDVEAIQKGFGTRIGLRNTFQTHRGGPGAWRSVDWLVINTDYIYRSDDADIDRRIARFFNYRPEYTIGGEHVQSDVRWAVTDTFALTGDLTWSLEHHDVPLWHLGAMIQHSPRFVTFIEYAEIQVLGSRLLTWGFDYALTAKYSLGYRQSLNLGDNETQDLMIVLERRLPQWRIVFQFRHDNINDEQSFGVALVPELFSRRQTAFSGFDRY